MKILVGEEEALFKINEGFLQGTSFFAEHGPPKAHREKPTAHTLPIRAVPEHGNEQGVHAEELLFNDNETIDSDADDIVTVDLTDDDADYVLRGKFYYTRDAFAILIGHLHEALPKAPKDHDGCNALFRAYALAQYYQVDLLQNHIIDALQKYYSYTTIPISDVVYLINHWGDNVNYLLAGYVVAQTGFEWAQNWAEYRKENPNIVDLLASPHKTIIEALIQASMQYTKVTPTADPAKHKRDWRLDLVR